MYLAIRDILIFCNFEKKEMEVLGNAIEDFRIKAKNFLVEMSLKEFYLLSKDILNNNEYQRKRVGSSNTVYSLLKDDLKKGCLIPPIVLAYPEEVNDARNLISAIQENKNKIVILDGLQRSYTIRDLFAESDSSNHFENNKLRVEIYTGINRIGILYRMLTLNTGQTRMSTRHQIEIIYSDYLINNISDDIKLLTDIDNNNDAYTHLGVYKYRDVIEGFTSYIERDYLTLERTDILDSIKNLENLVSPENNALFEDFITVYTKFIGQLYNNFPTKINTEELNLKGAAFGEDVISIFNKSQSLTGFGCTIGKLIDFGSNIKSIKDLNDIIPIIKDIDEGLSMLLVYLDKVRNQAKKIGNDQRLYFHLFYKSLFDSASDGYASIKNSAKEAYNQYQRITM